MALGLFIKRRWVWMPCAFATVLALTYVLWPGPKDDPAPPLPSPNGYDDFVKAGKLLDSISSDYSKMPPEELRAYVGTNQEPLRLVRLGLGRDSQVPTEDSMAYIQKHLPDLSSIKALAQLLSAEGRLAESEARYDDAAKIHLEVVRYGQSSVHGGLIIDKLVGIAIENIGLAGLERVAQQLDARPCRNSLQALEKIDLRLDSATEYLKRDRQWGRKATGTSALNVWIQSAWMTKSLRQSDRKFTARLAATDRRRRHLLLNLAARAYELENSRRPLRAEELVPSVLRAVPKDPETGTNLMLNLGL